MDYPAEYFSAVADGTEVLVWCFESICEKESISLAAAMGIDSVHDFNQHTIRIEKVSADQLESFLSDGATISSPDEDYPQLERFWKLAKAWFQFTLFVHPENR